MLYVKPPPIGVMPKWLWEEKYGEVPLSVRDPFRTQALLDAVFRYRAAGIGIGGEWNDELAEILTRNVRTDANGHLPG